MILWVLTVLYYFTILIFSLKNNFNLTEVEGIIHFNIIYSIDKVIRYSFLKEIVGFLFLSLWAKDRLKEQWIYGFYLWLIILPISFSILLPHYGNLSMDYFRLPIFLLFYTFVDKYEILPLKKGWFLPIFLLLFILMGIYFSTYWKLYTNTTPLGGDYTNIKPYQLFGRTHLLSGLLIYIIPLREILCILGLQYPSRRNTILLLILGILSILLYMYFYRNGMSVGSLYIKNIGYLLGVIGAYQSILFWKEGSYHG